MSTNYTVATALTDLPSDALTAAHRVALDQVGFAVADHAGQAYLYTPAEGGPSTLDLEMFQPFDETWREWLEDTGLVAHAGEPFVEELRSLVERGEVDWTAVLQLVLQHMPPQVAHIDVQGSWWCDKLRRGEFGGFAVRVTREAVHGQESAGQFFARLDQEPVASADASGGSCVAAGAA